MKEELQRLRERMRKADVSVKHAAELIGVYESTIHRWFAGSSKISLQYFRELQGIVIKAEEARAERAAAAE
jgi:plasmid maintenance system antidote protein VapI